MSNKLIQIAREVLEIEADLPYRINYDKAERATVDDFTMYTFPQTWGSTALGFGVIGGQAMTVANTYVFIPDGVDQYCFVYFGGRFAYAVSFCQAVMDDVLNQRMEPVSRSGKYKARSDEVNLK